jgi:MFS family permease
MAIFYGATSIGAIICGLIAYATDKLGDAGYRSWRLFFIFVSTPPILIGLLVFFFQPDYPQTAEFLDEKEKETLVKGLKSQHVYNDKPKVFDMNEFKMTLLDWQTW